ncbi:transient receptor potential cation channel protein painless-like [Drosophila innubila]|uniref:transient receptor potential cation channel protein painless-like n=1 Tax=Drosophila innubila TaxID=198719 RepID=UPI00148C4D46|nr:transient receptor potential cation channel protein painless-like [Drosophila innubila]
MELELRELQLSRAFEQRDVKLFEETLRLHGNPNKPDGNGITIYEKVLATADCGKFIQLCIRYGCKSNYINENGKAAINFASDSRDSENIRILLEHQGVQVDNKYNDLTPLNSLAKGLNIQNVDQVKECIKLLLLYGASPNILDDVEMSPLQYVLYNKNLENNKKQEIISLLLQHHDIYIDDDLRYELLEWNPSLVLKPNTHPNPSIEVNRVLTLEECITSGDHVNFDQLLNDQFDVNGKPQGFDKTYVEIAIAYGNWYALEKLLQHKDLKMPNNLELLHQLTGRLDERPQKTFSDYNKCFEVLLASGLVDVNERDKSDRTPLYYAISYNKEFGVRELLKHDAYLGMKSYFNELAIDDIDPVLLEEHFDDCITSEGSSRADKNFKIILNYKTLKLPSNINSSEMEPICTMAKSKALRHLLKHPLITTLITLKWQSISLLFYLYTVISALFTIFLMLHIISMYSHDWMFKFALILKLISWLSVGYIAMVDVLIKSCLTRFTKSSIFGLIINILIIALSIFNNIMNNPEQYRSRIIAAFTILLIAVKLTRHIGSLPVYSLSMYVLMLREVSFTFLRSCIPYSILVISFGLSFYVLNFHNLSEKSISDAIMRAISMSTGEFNENEIGFKELFFDRLIFVIFVIYISIVLMNLLSALAFSDTQAIQASAEVNSLTHIVNLLSCYEVLFTKSWGRIESIRKLINHFANIKVANLPESVYTFPNKKHIDTTVTNSCEMMPLTNKNTRTRQDNQNNINMHEDHFIMKFSNTTIKRFLQVIDQKAKIERQRQLNSTIAKKLENIENMLSIR